MKRKTLTIISIVSIIIISLLLLGLTYGYYLTKIDGNKNAKSVEVVTGNSKVLYTDLSNSDISEVIEPGYKNVKIFTVQNTGDVTATYSIYLVDVVNNFNRTQDITYNLYKKSGTITDVTIETDLSTWTRVNTIENVTFPTTMSVIAPNETIITPNEIYTYVLKVEYYNHPTDNQNEDQGKTLAFKVNLRAEETYTNPFSEGTLAYNIYENGAQVLDTNKNELKIDKTYEEKLTMTTVSDGTDMTDVGIFTAPDDYGTSYYFRGPVKNNYVDFAGFTWRIVRINGDGSVRLILDGLLNTVNIPGTETKVHSSGTAFNSSNDKNAYVGYMYGTPGSKTYQGEHEFTGDKSTYIPGTETPGHSTIKVALDKFYDTYLKSSKNYIADTLFCGDKTLADQDGTDDNIGGVADQTGTGTNKTYYATTERLWYSSGLTSITTANPTLMCANNANDDYSRYSVNVQILKSGKTTNGDLTYPIALLSADELVLAGAFKDTPNTNYYLHNADTIGSSRWWTMSPYDFDGSYAYEFLSVAPDYSLIIGNLGNLYSSRPVINLRSDVLLESGDGTSGNGAYKVRLAS